MSRSVVGVGGSEASWTAFSWACGDAVRHDRDLVVVFVSKRLFGVTLPCAGIGYESRHIEEALREQAASIRSRAEESAARLGLSMTFVRASGDTRRELVLAADAWGADVLVVGSSSGLVHRVSGSVGRRLISKCKSALLVVVPSFEVPDVLDGWVRGEDRSAVPVRSR